MILVSLGTGCRLFNKSGGDSGGWGGSRDPLFGRDRIPATDLPTGREIGRGGKDPLFTTPVSNENKLSSDLPARDNRTPFRTGPETTAAGLARGTTDDSPLLSVQAEEPADDRRTRGGPVMLKGTRGDTSIDRIVEDLKRYGVKAGTPFREGADYVIRGELESSTGVIRQFEGVGSTADRAAQDLLEQVRNEQGR